MRLRQKKPLQQHGRLTAVVNLSITRSFRPFLQLGIFKCVFFLILSIKKHILPIRKRYRELHAKRILTTAYMLAERQKTRYLKMTPVVCLRAKYSAARRSV